MSDIHAPERKHVLPVRLTESEFRRVKAAARADDRSANSWVLRVVRAELDAREATEAAR